MAEIITTKQTWTTLATQMGWDYRTLKDNCKPIKSKLDQLVGKENYRALSAAQVKLIITHLGWD